MNEKDIDVHVAEARELAARLNDVLETLKDGGVDCVSVIGAPPSYGDLCLPRDLSRISLVLNFKPTTKVAS
jgi:hypothetical protein